MTRPMRIEATIHFNREGQGAARRLEPGPQPAAPAPGRVPRVARLMALALRFEQQVRRGELANYSELAAVGHVTRARISQIMNLLNLAPDIIEAILHLPRTERGRDAIKLRQLQPIAATCEWRRQRRMWEELLRNNTSA